MNVTFSPDDLKPIIESVVAQVLDRFGNPDRLAFPEKEAAALLGLKQHQLRDARLRGQVKGSQIGRGYLYTRQDLLRYLESRKED